MHSDLAEARPSFAPWLRACLGGARNPVSRIRAGFTLVRGTMWHFKAVYDSPSLIAVYRPTTTKKSVVKWHDRPLICREHWSWFVGKIIYDLLFVVYIMSRTCYLDLCIGMHDWNSSAETRNSYDSLAVSATLWAMAACDRGFIVHAAVARNPLQAL
jgi:hypothetical protein